MKAATLAFLFTLWLALGSGGYFDPYLPALGSKAYLDPYLLPLSMFRDGPLWPYGYALFGLLQAIGALMALTLWRADRSFEAGVFMAGVLLLVVIAVTPSDGGFHFLCSLVLLSLLYVYYAVLLRLAESRWRFGHWALPLVLAGATSFHSYGLWQKTFIVYFVLTIAVHHHFLGRWVPRNAAPRGWEPAPPLRRRVVYVLEEGSEWHRRR
jgi:hypothetical protein